MRLPLSFFIGLRYHRAKNSNGFISFISASSTLGIVLGVAVLIIGLSVMNGFERELRDRFLAIVSHGELEAVNPPLSDHEQLLSSATNNSQVLGAAPYISFSALVQKGKTMKALALKGIDPELEKNVTNLHQYVGDDAWHALAENQAQLVLGAGIADLLGVSVGEQVTLLLPKANQQNRLSSPQRIRVKVVGLMNAGGQLDNQLAFINLAYAQKLMQWQEGVSGISLRVVDPLKADKVVRSVAKTYPQLVYIKSWIRQHGYLYQDIQLVRTIMYAIMLLIVAVASFNIVSTLILAVSEKRGDIAILKTMGASDASLLRSFVVYGSYNGVLGCAWGAVLGIAGSFGLPKLVGLIESLMGHTLLSADIYFIDFLPVKLIWTDVLAVVGAALLLSMLATIWPAWQATRVKPAQELG
ncbi:lipoprotein-releasing ABC transporter permease subunit LolE [Agarivorans sp. 1_MG-2023]|uniref:lipoprotein-releasing ABC transporter permease subunit LolE n=1 Tax=Agarivorans sp. 1_MG-2023 TaxID=3062634 RepID=UPI0026E43CCF|nr:lipoprotein-releasing ABC transporter permease subunit LolE [Agarivorans sp. 1_MG-2023]MDO6762015.1 lipoprotein-releasing ABC transporter permease subunit LolE [Agarivorans sp. 1_MG-2023]